MTRWHLRSRAHIQRGLAAALIAAFIALATMTLASMPASAHAVEAGSAGRAAVQIVSGNDANGAPIVAVNACYGIDEGTTWKDLLDMAVAAGDLEGYELSDWGFPNSFTIDGVVVGNASDWSTYWSSSIDGNSFADELSSGNYQTIEVKDGVRYQAALDSYPSVIDWSQVPNPQGCSGDAGSVDDTSESDDTGTGDDSSGTDSADNGGTSFTTGDEATSSAIDELINTIVASYSGTKLDWNAMVVAAACKTSLADKDAIIANARAAYSDPDATSLQRSIIALTALGVDATAVPADSGTIDLVAKMASTSDAQSTMYAQAFALLAYASGPYPVPSNALMDANELIEHILATQIDGGGFSFDGQRTDADTTAMMLTALSAYRSVDGVEASIEKGLAYLKSVQNSDGGFGTTLGAAGSNGPSTAQVIVALCALDEDPAAFSSTTGISALTYLLSTANDTQTAFLYDGSASDFATEQGVRALLAYKGLLATKGSYNIYLRAKDGVTCANAAVDDGSQKESDTSGSTLDRTSEDESQQDTNNGNAKKGGQSLRGYVPTVQSTGTPAGQKLALAATGDPTFLSMILLAMASLASASAATITLVRTRRLDQAAQTADKNGNTVRP